MSEKEYEVRVKVTFDGIAIVGAESEDEARDKFDSGDFMFDVNAASMCDWVRRGDLKEIK